MIPFPTIFNEQNNFQNILSVWRAWLTSGQSVDPHFWKTDDALVDRSCFLAPPPKKKILKLSFLDLNTDTGWGIISWF